MKKLTIIILCIVHYALCIASTIPTNLPNFRAVIPSRTDKVRTISDSAKFYLVTCEPGAEIYERFGHSGIRVCDSINRVDEVFHWGLFSFDTPNFVGRFISGNTDYEMGVYSTKFFLPQYRERGSSVYAQELNLSPEQKQELYAKLWNNYRPENRKYRYNFIYDNCATRPYQLISSVYNNKITNQTPKLQITYRDIINKYVPIGSPFNTGINLIIGSKADRIITTKESVSFPMYTMEALRNTHFITHDGTTEPIVLAQETMYSAPRKEFTTSPFTFWAWVIIPLLLTIASFVYTAKKKRYMPLLTPLTIFASALIGIIISYLWFFSQHPLVDNNINLLWCNPLNLFLVAFLFIHKSSTIRTFKLAISTLSLIFGAIYLFALSIDYQAITPQLASLWLLIFTVNATIVYTYRYKFKKLRHKK